MNEISCILGSLHSRTTIFAGLGKGSGKTTFFRTALYQAQKAGPVGIFTIGFQGVDNQSLPICVVPNDIVITTIPIARASLANFEILETLPGRSAIGHLCICRAIRAGTVALVGPEHFSQLDDAITFVSLNKLAKSVLVDGAGGRLTHASALPNSQFLYCAIADNANFRRVAENIELISRLANLPMDECPVQAEKSNARIEGPLTVSTIKALPKEIDQISIGAFSDCFLDAASFSRALQHYKITVRRQVPLLGFVVGLKNILRESIIDISPSAAGRIAFSPFEFEAAQ